jgi:hypothetical protein
VLKAAMLEVMLADKADACRIPIRMCFYGKVLRFSSSPTRHARLFKRKNAHFSDDIVHEKIVLPDGARIMQLKAPILHHSFRDVSHAIEKMNRYSSYSANIRLENKERTTLWKTLLGTAWMFLRCYVLQGGFWDGQAGFLFAIMNAQGTFYRGIKVIYEDKQRAQLPSVTPTKESYDIHQKN